MLILSRKAGEKILILPDIVITVIDMKNNHRVRLGFEAPDDIKIWRKELRDQMEEAIDDLKEATNKMVEGVDDE